MTDDRRRDAEDSDGPEDLESEVARIERELAEHFEREHGEIVEGLNPLFTDPPHPGPIPEVLREGPPAPAPKPASTMSSIAGMGAAWGVALEFMITILAGLGLGWLFDRWRQTAPTGALIGLVLGFVLAFVRIIRVTQRQERQEARRKSEGR